MPPPIHRTPALLPHRSPDAPAGPLDGAWGGDAAGVTPWVGIAGSADLLGALARLLPALPRTSGLAWVILPLAARHDDALPGALARLSPLPVAPVASRTRLEPDHVYLMPHNGVLLAATDDIDVACAVPDHGGRPLLDAFFGALAAARGARAAVVVLSGTDDGGDGAIGVARVREHGGVVVAQDPREAGQAGLPHAAIASGAVDWVLGAARIGERLQGYFHPGGRLRRAGRDPHQSDDAVLGQVLDFLQRCTGHDFGGHARAALLRRIERRMRINAIPTLRDYLDALYTRPGETEALRHELLARVGAWFHDPDALAALRARLPDLFRGKGPGEGVRLWVVGCATGEEVYSLAMLLDEHARELAAPPSLQIFATDAAPEAIRIAREGVYPASIRADVSDERLRRHFVREGGGLRVRRELREMVMFAVHDVLHDLPFSHLDLVGCRHLLADLAPQAQARLCGLFHFALAPRGLLLLGAGQAPAGEGGDFTPVDAAHGLHARSTATRALHFPAGAPMPASSPPPRLRPLRPLPPPPARTPPADTGTGTGTGTAPPRPAPGPAWHHAGGIRHGEPWGDVHLNLLERLAPPSILIDAAHDIVHLSPSAGRHLSHRAGEPDRNLLRLVSDPLRIELRAALLEAAGSGRPVETRVAAAGEAGAPLAVRVVPVREGRLTLFLVLLGGPIAPPEVLALRPVAEHPGAEALEREVAALQSRLRETVRRHEASTQEFTASNEELQTINEELRSATEDLRTSREELQSINEEFLTVNRELKTKIDELAHANSDLQNLMNATAIATLFLDRDLRIARYTPMAVTLFNFIPGDIGRPLSDLTPRLQYAELASDAARVLERLVPMEREVGLADGTWFLARVLPYRTMEDRIAGVVLSFIDITERKRADEVSQWLSAVVASSMDAIISFSLQGTILSWNGGARRVFGHVAEEMVGQPLSTLAWEDGAGWCADLLERVNRMRSIDNLETLGRARAGHALHLAVTASPIVNVEGRVVGGTASLRDTSETRRNEEALRLSQDELLRALAAQGQARAELERADSAKDRFLAVLSHELRNPLAAVTTASELLARSELPADERARATALVRRQARTMKLLLDDLLDVSRLAVGRFELRMREVDLAEVVEPAIEAVEAALRAAGHQLVLDLPAAPVRLHVDPLRITQVLVNLLGNAAKYTPPDGRIGLRVRVGRDAIRMVVSDNGVGIEPGRIDQIFELYTQGPLATHALNDGLGLGLSLARTIVGLHGGTVEGASDGPGRGSRFTIRLPVAATAATAPEPAAAPRPAAAAPPAPPEPVALVAPVEAPAFAPREILVADDNADAAWALSQLLRRAGHRTRMVGGGAEALASALARAPDVAVLDIGMPDIDGVEVARRLRAAPGTRDIVLIALTGWSSRADHARAVAAGFDVLLSKPADLREVLRAMARAESARRDAALRRRIP